MYVCKNTKKTLLDGCQLSQNRAQKERQRESKAVKNLEMF